MAALPAVEAGQLADQRNMAFVLVAVSLGFVAVETEKWLRRRGRPAGSGASARSDASA
jgi:hypothetical protein